MTFRLVGILVVALSLTAAACRTTTAARQGSATAHEWLERHGSTQLDIVTDGGGRQTRVVIEARSPFDLRFQTREAGVVPLEQVRQVIDVRRGRGTLEGAGLGVAAGALFGALYGASSDLGAFERSMDCTLVCNHADAAKLDALMFGTLGLLLGAAIGAAVGDRDVLDLR